MFPWVGGQCAGVGVSLVRREYFILFTLAFYCLLISPRTGIGAAAAWPSQYRYGRLGQGTKIYIIDFGDSGFLFGLRAQRNLTGLLHVIICQSVAPATGTILFVIRLVLPCVSATSVMNTECRRLHYRVASPLPRF